jgi:hypothetical protein
MMTTKKDLKAKLRKKSADSAARADALLIEELNSLREMTRTDLETLRPKITDQKAYDELIAVVEEASRKNMDLALLQQRLVKLGSNVVQVGKEVLRLLKP